MKKNFETLITKIIKDHILLVTFNRPKFANAFNTQMAQELIELMEDISMSSDEIRTIIFTGSGDKAFIESLLVHFILGLKKFILIEFLK